MKEQPEHEGPRVALIGATGQVGRHILAELIDRGFAVTAISRHPEAVGDDRLVTSVAADLFDTGGLCRALAGHAVAVSSVPFRLSDAAVLIDAVKRSGCPRYVAVGGAGTLEVEPGVTLYERRWKDLPDAVRIEGSGARVSLDALRRERELNWTCVTPSAKFVQGERSGRFRLGGDAMLVAADGTSSISYADFAVALVDEIERPVHARARFTVGY